MILRVRRNFFEITTFPNTNIVVQYIDLYVSTISRHLVMSLISSGTPNYLRYIKTHKIVIRIVIKR